MLRERISAEIVMLVLSVVLAVAVILSFFTTVDTNFVVEAQTEVMSAEMAISAEDPETHIRWRLERAQLCAGNRVARRVRSSQECALQVDRIVAQPFTLEIKNGVSLAVERLGESKLQIALVPNAAESTYPTATIRVIGGTSAEHHQLNGAVFLTVDIAGEAPLPPLSFPLLASRIEVGREAAMRASSPQPLLLGGSVTLTGATLLGSTNYSARIFPLQHGDIVAADQTSSLISLLVRVDETQGLRLIGRVEAPSLTVSSFFGSERVLKLNFLHKISNDPLMTSLWSLVGLLMALLAMAGIKFGRNAEDAE